MKYFLLPRAKGHGDAGSWGSGPPRHGNTEMETLGHMDTEKKALK